jgi:hypothetical protein
MSKSRQVTPEWLREEIVRLAPWHYDIKVTSDISTRVSLDADRTTRAINDDVSFLDVGPSYVSTLKAVYPNGLDGRSMLDCACNCGAYLFWAKELGAGECFGSDVREFWIRQARFLLDHRQGPKDNIRFEVADLYDLGQFGLGRFDVSFFGGIFYHLPDPLSGLKIVADLTDELIIINTATHNGFPDGLLVIEEESRELVLSGVHGLNWYPTGPDVLVRICKWLGFPETRLQWWITEGASHQPSRLGRLQMYAARDKSTFAHFDQARADTDATTRDTAEAKARRAKRDSVVTAMREQYLACPGVTQAQFEEDLPDLLRQNARQQALWAIPDD